MGLLWRELVVLRQILNFHFYSPKTVKRAKPLRFIKTEIINKRSVDSKFYATQKNSTGDCHFQKQD